MSAPPDLCELVKTFKSLSRPARIVAMGYGATYPLRVGTAQMARLLWRCRFRYKGKPMAQYKYKAVCADVKDRGIILRTALRGRLRAHPSLATWLAVEAFKQRKLARIERLFPDEITVIGARDLRDRLRMRLRCAAVSNRFDEIRTDFRDLEPGDWAWLTSHGGHKILAKMPDDVAGTALTDCFQECIVKALPPESFIKQWRARASSPEMHANQIAFIRLLQGRWDDALEIFASLPKEVGDARVVRTGWASARAMIATVRGQDDEAEKLIDRAIAEEGAGTRKKNLFPDHYSFMIALLSLVRHRTPANAAKFDKLVRIGEKVVGYSPFKSLLYYAKRTREGRSSRFMASVDNTPKIDRLTEALCSVWMRDNGAFTGSDAADRRYKLLYEFSWRAYMNDYVWVAAECLEAMQRLEVGPPKLPGVEVSPGELAATLRKDIGATSLGSVVTPSEPWEYPLHELERIAYETRQQGQKQSKKTSTERQRRMAWILTENEFKGVDITPKVQLANKNGTWTKGRTLSLSRLQQQAATMAFLVDKDRAAITKIRVATNRSSGRRSLYLSSDALYVLAGHPNVQNDHGEPMKIVRVQPQLLVEEKDDVVRVHVWPHPDASVGERFFASFAGATRCEVTRFTPGFKRLCSVIPYEGLQLPVAAKERLLAAVSPLAGEMRVQGMMADETDAETEIEADAAPWVRLEPSGTGLIATIVVEPVPESGVYVPPGEGGTTVFATRGDESIRAVRDLKAERSAVTKLLQQVPMLRGFHAVSGSSLEDVRDCLELLDQLRDARARCLWPNGELFKIVAKADTPSLRLVVKSAQEWFAASGELVVDGRSVDLAMLLGSLDRGEGSRFLELGDGDFLSLTSSFRRHLEDLKTLSVPAGKGKVRINPLAALALDGFLENTQLDADQAWRDQRARFEDAQTFEPEIPTTLRAELRPYQEEGFRWLSRLARWGAGACLADDMGLGKTVQTLAVLLTRAPEGPALVVAPTSVVANWVAEATRFAPTLRMVNYSGVVGVRSHLLEDIGPLDVVVTTYGVMQNDIKRLTEIEWSTVVLDEAQAIKNPLTKRARAVRRLNSRFRVTTTGTPIQNNLMDLFSIFAFLNPGMLGSQKRFRETFALAVERDGDPEARARLRRLIAPFILRRLKTDVLEELPARTEITLPVDLSSSEAAFYEALRQQAMEELEGPEATGENTRRIQVLAHLTRLRLACCNARLVKPEMKFKSSKLATFLSTLEELRANRHKVLVFSQFVRHLKLIEEQVSQAGIPYQYLDGSTPAKARAQRIQAFQRGEGDVFLISLKAGGMGLNLTAADYVIHMDPWWNPATEDQASDRAHRIGQTRPVTIYRLVAKGTIEEKIVELHRHKRDLADRLLTGADSTARLSAEELLQLLRNPDG